MGAYVVGEVEVVNEITVAPSSVIRDGAVVADGDLSVKVNAFYYDLAGFYGRYVGSVGNLVTDESVNYVYLDGLAKLGVTTGGYPAALHIRLARVVAQGGFIVRVILERAFLSATTPLRVVKAGTLRPSAFLGTPKRGAVTFDIPLPDSNYAVTALPHTDGSRTFGPAAESKLPTGFTVNLHAGNIAGLIDLDWIVVPYGE